jgi:hypothetical protein
LAVLPTLPDASVDAVVTDPPAGIGFMGKEWDDFRRARNPADAGRDDVFGRTSRRGPEYGRRDRENFVAWLAGIMAECYRVARPGSRALVWAIPKTSHWTGWAIEDAGWVVEDRVSHFFGSGFPKHQSKLKPACEDWWMAWKPAKYATPLNIDACRIPAEVGADLSGGRVSSVTDGWDRPWKHDPAAVAAAHVRGVASVEKAERLGRWPSHVVLDEEAGRLLDEQAGECGGQDRRTNLIPGTRPGGFCNVGHDSGSNVPNAPLYGDTGGASRFFYCPKSPKSDRGRTNPHPTVKHTDLMGWLCRLITPPGGTVLDPFTGSGSTGVAARAEGFGFVGIEREAEYFATAADRTKPPAQLLLPGLEVR